jgi:hypothetical protein
VLWFGLVRCADVRCGSSEHAALLAVAVPGALLYIFGFSGAIAFALFRNRNRLAEYAGPVCFSVGQSVVLRRLPICLLLTSAVTR